jgi:hypothetical protein
MAATVALAGRVLWLHESRNPDAAFALELMNRLRPHDRSSSITIYDYLIAELLRPVVGIESTRAVLESLPPREHNRASLMLYLRALLPVLALPDEHDRTLDARIAEARALARSACAPALRLIADWAQAAASRMTDPGGSLERAAAAAAALERYGERYTAARLLAELLPLVEGAAASALAEETAVRLTAMGARASAALAVRTRVG